MPNRTFDTLPEHGEIEKLIVTYLSPIDIVSLSKTSRRNLRYAYPFFATTLGEVKERIFEVDPRQRLATVKNCCYEEGSIAFVMLAVCFSNFTVWLIVFGSWLKEHDINRFASAAICLSAATVSCCAINALLLQVFDTDIEFRHREIYTSGLTNLGMYRGRTLTVVRDIEEGLLANQHTAAI